MTSPVSSDQLRISIEMGEEYEPSDRLRAALDELGSALTEAQPPEVAGYLGDTGTHEVGHVVRPGFRVLGFDSLAVGAGPGADAFKWDGKLK